MDKDLQAFLDVVDDLLDYVMEDDVKAAAVKELQSKIQTEVYDKYTPRVYNRKKDYHGLQDPRDYPVGSMEYHYDSRIKLLTIEDVRPDWEPTSRKHEWRNVAEVVESGDGYDYKDLPPRPFHKKAEEALIKSGEVDRILTQAMETNLGAWSL